MGFSCLNFKAGDLRSCEHSPLHHFAAHESYVNHCHDSVEDAAVTFFLCVMAADVHLAPQQPWPAVSRIYSLDVYPQSINKWYSGSQQK